MTIVWVALARFYNSRASGSRSIPIMLPLAFLAALVTSYYAGSLALASGYLGSANQVNSVEQMRRTGSLLEGARPEWSATFELMKDQPLGHGPGAVPTPHDIGIARAGLNSIGISGRGDYYMQYMFGGHFKLHSVVADLWISFSILGILLGIGFLVAIARGMIAGRRHLALHAFVGLSATWFLFFGPILSDLPRVVFAVAMSLRILGDLSQSSHPRVDMPSSA
jgi:hypothetical protein